MVRIVEMLIRMIDRNKLVREDGIVYGNEYGYGEETGRPDFGGET